MTDTININNEPEKVIVLIDSYNIIYRAFHGNKQDLRTSTGIPSGAIYTALNMVKNLNRRFHIDEACAIFDGGTNFRTEIDSEYKANRKSMPDDLRIQIPHIKRGLEVLGWPLIQATNMEADDLLGSIALNKAALGYKVYIISGDKDFRQIVSGRITIVDTMYNIFYTPDVIFEKMGVRPEQVHGYLTLMGDSSDNISGIAGIGKKTAADLMNKYKSIENLILNAHEIGGKVGVNLKEAIENGNLQKCATLVSLRTEDIDHSVFDLMPKMIDDAKLEAFIEEFQFNSWKSKVKKII